MGIRKTILFGLYLIDISYRYHRIETVDNVVRQAYIQAIVGFVYAKFSSDVTWLGR